MAVPGPTHQTNPMKENPMTFVITYADSSYLEVRPTGRARFRVSAHDENGDARKHGPGGDVDAQWLLSQVPEQRLDAFEQWLGELQDPRPPKECAELIAEISIGNWVQARDTLNALARRVEEALLAERTQAALDAARPDRLKKREVQDIVDALAGDAR